MSIRVHAIFLLLVATSCGGDGATTPPPSTKKTVDVFTIGDSFSPAFADAAVGDTVRWNFAAGSDGMGHNVRFAVVTGRPADINVLKTGTASRVFTVAGNFNYFCDVHPGMNGSVTVK